MTDYGKGWIAEHLKVTNAPEPAFPSALPEPNSGGLKFDDGKLPWHLVPGDAMEEILYILQFGAAKYAERNWEKGMNWSRCFSATMRHMWKWWMGEHVDPETGRSHLAHAGCCILFLIAYEIRKVGKDDRP